LFISIPICICRFFYIIFTLSTAILAALWVAEDHGQNLALSKHRRRKCCNVPESAPSAAEGVMHTENAGSRGGGYRDVAD